MRERGAHQLLLRGQQSCDRLVPDLVVVAGVERTQPAEAGVVDQDVESAKTFRDFGNDAFDRGRVADIESPAFGLSTFGFDFLDDARDARFIDVGHRNDRALLRKQVSRRAAHSTRGAGDEHAATLHRAVEFFDRIHLATPYSMSKGLSSITKRLWGFHTSATWISRSPRLRTRKTRWHPTKMQRYPTKRRSNPNCRSSIRITIFGTIRGAAICSTRSCMTPRRVIECSRRCSSNACRCIARTGPRRCDRSARPSSSTGSRRKARAANMERLGLRRELSASRI